MISLAVDITRGYATDEDMDTCFSSDCKVIIYIFIIRT